MEVNRLQTPSTEGAILWLYKAIFILSHKKGKMKLTENSSMADPHKHKLGERRTEVICM
jgi:hypothetical protein